MSAPDAPGHAPAVPGTAGYGRHAAELADRYESLRFEDVHSVARHLYPPPPARALDIGAGSGRDAAALARLGHPVVAAEPTEALRLEGQRRHADLPIDWLDDHLPGLPRLRGRGQRFDLILLTAVWMHLDPREQALAMASVAELAADGGLVSMSLRHGPVPEGRRMFEVTVEATVALAAQHGLRHHFDARRDDMLSREDVHWNFLLLRRDPRPR